MPGRSFVLGTTYAYISASISLNLLISIYLYLYVPISPYIDIMPYTHHQNKNSGCRSQASGVERSFGPRRQAHREHRHQLALPLLEMICVAERDEKVGAKVPLKRRISSPPKISGGLAIEGVFLFAFLFVCSFFGGEGILRWLESIFGIWSTHETCSLRTPN